MYFRASFIEQNGEQQYGYDYLVEADTLVAARAKTRLFLRDWYADFDGIVDGDMEFMGGAITVRKASVVETTKEAFTESMVSHFTI